MARSEHEAAHADDMDRTSPARKPLPDEAPHILVVDDDRRLRDLLARFLGDNGYRVTTAANAAEADRGWRASSSTPSCSTS